MKTHAILLLAAALVLPGLLSAQTITSVVPGLVSYQGRVLNASGALVGLGAPVNRTVTFRVWKHASDTGNANLLYSEQQTVTIADGEFSVLIGQGVATTGTPLGYSESAKGPPTVKISDLGVFNNATTFLGVTVDDGTAAADNEVVPRQQVVTSAYAFRAKFAESIGSNGSTAITAVDGGNVGVGVPNPTVKLDVSGDIKSSANISGSSITSTGSISGTSISGTSISSGTGTGSFGSAAPSFHTTTKLLVEGSDTDTRPRQFVIRGGGSTDLFKQLQFGIKTDSDYATIQSYLEGVGAGPRKLVLNPVGGNVGIYNAAPSEALDVNGKIKASDAITSGGALSGTALSVSGGITAGVGGITAAGAITGSSLNVGTGTITGGTLTVTSFSPLNMRVSGTGGYAFSDPNGGDDGLFWVSDGKVSIKTDGAERARIDSLGMTLTGTKTMTGGFAQWSCQSVFKGPQMAVLMGELDTNGSDAGGGVATLGGHNEALTQWKDLAINPYGGNVGIGTPSPGAMLDVNGTLKAGNIVTTGNMGVGTTTPTRGKLEVVGNAATFDMAAAYYAMDQGGETLYTATSDIPASIYADDNMIAKSFKAVSDERIKVILGTSDSQSDLNALLGIQITDYTMKDKVAKGAARYKKVIAQQVETVFPQAVSKVTDVVPDIYTKASVKGGWVSLKTDLKKGDCVRLIAEKAEGIHEVLEVAEGRFRTAFQPEGTDVFVYGREVKDFRVVDYEAISMLNVSATQQLKKEKDAEVKALQAENAELRARLAKLEAKDKARDSKLAAIEALLSGEKPAVRTVSLKKNQGAE